MKKEILALKENSITLEAPKYCKRKVCTSCPEMKGRADGYRRAINDVIKILETKDQDS